MSVEVEKGCFASFLPDFTVSNPMEMLVMKLPYVEVDGVLLDVLVHQRLEEEGFALVPGLRPEEDYPWVQKGDVRELLHHYVLRLHHPWMTAEFFLENDLLGHHKNERKFDARLENLEVRDRSGHTRHHNKSRQVFKPKKKEDLFGFYAPKNPGAVTVFTKKEREELLEDAKKNVSAVPPVLVRGGEEAKMRREEDREVEARLAALLPRLRLEDEEKEDGTSIPPPAARHHRRDRLLGIHPIRLGCTPGEAAFVRVFIEMSDLKEIAKNLGLSEPALRRVFNRPTVSKAIENWRRFRRLPPPNSFKKLRIYLAHEGLGHLAARTR